MKKGTAAVTIGCIIAVLLIGYYYSKNQEEEKRTSIKIGISVYNQYDTFVSSLIEQVKKTAAKKESETELEITIDILNAAGSQMEQNDQVEKFIKNNYDIICVNLVDRTDPALIIDKVQNADIPIIFFNRELVPEDLKRYHKAYYVGAVTIEPGIIQGNLVVDLFRNNPSAIDKNGDGKIQYIMLEGEAGHQDAIVRTEYAINTVVERGVTVEKLDYALANWNRDQAKTKTDKLIEQFGNQIEAIFANNDDMALGAIDAYKARETDIAEMPIVVGIDGTKEGIEALREGSMYGTAYNDAAGQGRSMLELAYSLVTKEKLPEDISITEERYIRYSYREINKDNVREFMSYETKKGEVE